MKKFLGSKSFVLILGVAILLGVLLLAAGLSSLEFKPGKIYLSDKLPALMPIAPLLRTTTGWWESVLTFLLILAFLGALLYALFNPEQRKRLLMALLRVGLFMAALFLFIFNLRSIRQLLHLGVAGNSQPASTPAGGEALAPPAFVQPELPAWQITLIAFTVVSIAAVGIWWLSRLFRRNRPAGSLADFERITQTTLDDLNSGKNWEDAIVQCYVRMSHAVNARRSLARQAAVTPTEFAAQLVRAGLPEDAVRRLTLLFERVRYGAIRSSPADAAEAVDCLTVILRACQVPA